VKGSYFTSTSNRQIQSNNPPLLPPVPGQSDDRRPLQGGRVEGAAIEEDEEDEG